MKPRAMSVWIVAAASSAVSPRSKRPGARLLVAGGEEADQVERLEEPPHDLARAPRALAERGGLLVGSSSASSASSLPSIPPGPFTSGEQRLRRQRLELGRQLAGVVGQPAARVDVREHLLERRRPRRAAPDRPTSPVSARARAAARRGRGRRRAARAGGSRDRRPGRRPETSRRARRAARPPGAGCRAARRRCRARRRRGPRPASPSSRATTAATCASRSSAIGAMPTFGLSETVAYAVISAPASRQRVEERRLARRSGARRCRPRAPRPIGGLGRDAAEADPASRA